MHPDKSRLLLASVGWGMTFLPLGLKPHAALEHPQKAARGT